MAGRPKGQKKTGGRIAGTPNKILSVAAVVRRNIHEYCASIGFDPLESMANMAKDESLPISVRAKCQADLAPYMYARLSQIEVEAGKELRKVIMHRYGNTPVKAEDVPTSD